MEEEDLKAKTITLKLKATNFEVCTCAQDCSLPWSVFGKSLAGRVSVRDQLCIHANFSVIDVEGHFSQISQELVFHSTQSIQTAI